MEIRRPDGSVDRQTVGLLPSVILILREKATRQSAPLLFRTHDFRQVSPDDLARRGEAITLFAMGMGEFEPSLAAGELPAAPLPKLVEPPYTSFAQPRPPYAVTERAPRCGRC
jgi:uncharacterized protein (TIGR03437 family)